MNTRIATVASVAIITTALSFSVTYAGIEPTPFLSFIRGDTNSDAKLDIGDPVRTLGILFLGNAEATCLDTLDSNDDGVTNIADATFTLAFLFNNGDFIPAPYPECGEDPTEDGLDCQDYPQENGCPSPIECLDHEALNELVIANVPPVVCIPPDATQVDAGGLAVVTICPAADASSDCGGTGLAGCPVFLDSIEATLDVEAETAFVAIRGGARDLPVLLESATSVTCTAQIPFEGVAEIQLELAEAGPDAVTIVDVLEVSLSDVDVSLEASGGVLCTLFAGLSDQFTDELRAQVESVADDLLAELQQQLEGVVLCVE